MWVKTCFLFSSAMFPVLLKKVCHDSSNYHCWKAERMKTTDFAISREMILSPTVQNCLSMSSPFLPHLKNNIPYRVTLGSSTIWVSISDSFQVQKQFKMQTLQRSTFSQIFLFFLFMDQQWEWFPQWDIWYELIQQIVCELHEPCGLVGCPMLILLYSIQQYLICITW